MEQKLKVKKNGFFAKSFRDEFPILQKSVNAKPLVYLDSCATSLTPNCVVDAVTQYYTRYNANIHRGVHALSEQATQLYEDAHQTVADFIHANSDEIIFTSGTTMSFNILAHGLGKELEKGDEVIISEMEHHSNIVPWQQLVKKKGIILKYIKVTKDYRLDLDHACSIITEKTKIVSVTHMSNVLGTINDVKLLGSLAHEKNALMIVDAAQSVPHMPVDVKKLNCDFLCFSGHKMFGPTGIGVLYGKRVLLEELKPMIYGGDMIKEVTWDQSSWNNLPWKFEAGTPNIAGGIGLGAAVEYIQRIGIETIQHNEEELTEYALEQLQQISGVTIYGPLTTKDRGAVISFSIDGVHAHDVSTILDREGIAVRGGHMCAMPLVTQVLKTNSVSRVSLSLYNTKEEIDKLVDAIQKVQEIFK